MDAARTVRTPNRRAQARAQARRTYNTGLGMEVTCPVCEAPSGSECHVKDRPTLSLDQPHPDRIRMAVAYRDQRALTIRCPVCNAAPGTGCKGRTDVHGKRFNFAKNVS
jgi:hypothetical protein